ncbi:Transportin-1 [Cichlidogyrus casuarinus]|uniref:Transportin-1 n=1 Tax=Cichlidogyrus casuarinus TaxID=1844966 RepID=A0ABD2Q977_9PLAT
MRENLLGALADDSETIRNCVSSLIPPIISKTGLSSWPDIFPSLINFAESSNTYLGEGALSTLQKIFEDCEVRLRDPTVAPSINAIIPRLIDFIGNQNINIKVSALKCVNHLLASRYPMNQHFEQLLRCLFALNVDTNIEVKKTVCFAFCALAEEYFDDICSGIYDIIDLMLERSVDPSEEVAREACEFWPKMYDNNVRTYILGEYLQRLIPILVNGMQYHDTDLQCLEHELEDNAHIEDRDEDIRPRFHRARGKLDESDNEEMPEDYTQCWTLRKCCASALDEGSRVFGGARFLPILLPIIEPFVSSPDWKTRESVILVLGAVSEGCMVEMLQYLPSVFPFLLQSLNDEKALIRSISCWTVSRYAKWLTSPAGKGFFEQFLCLLLERILDRNKRVQEAACSAFAAVVEEGESCMVPYLGRIVSCFAEALEQYKSKNLNLLCDAICRLAESVHTDLNQPQFVEALMTPLCKKWENLADNDTQMFSLLECLSACSFAFGESFLFFHKYIFERCIRITKDNLLAQVSRQPRLAMFFEESFMKSILPSEIG